MPLHLSRQCTPITSVSGKGQKIKMLHAKAHILGAIQIIRGTLGSRKVSHLFLNSDLNAFEIAKSCLRAELGLKSRILSNSLYSLKPISHGGGS